MPRVYLKILNTNRQIIKKLPKKSGKSQSMPVKTKGKISRPSRIDR